MHNEKMPEPEPYGMGLQISLVFCTEAAVVARLWSAAQTFGRDVSRIGLVQVSEDRRRAPVGDHVPICISIPPKYAVPNVAGNLRRESAMQTVRKFGARRKDFTDEHLWARGYLVSTVALDASMVRAYIRNQEDEDERYHQMKLEMG